MADMITLTPQSIRITTSGNTFPLLQPIYLAVDIGGYDFLDIETGVIANEGSVTTFTLDLYTGMQTQTDNGWQQVGSNHLINTATANTWNIQNFPNGLLRYIRWQVTAQTPGTAMTFFVRGMARRYA